MINLLKQIFIFYCFNRPLKLKILKMTLQFFFVFSKRIKKYFKIYIFIYINIFFFNKLKFQQNVHYSI